LRGLLFSKGFEMARMIKVFFSFGSAMVS
jgi:hypothetical protein